MEVEGPRLWPLIRGALEAVVATARLSPSAAASGHDAPALDGLPRTHDHGREMTVLPLVGRERELGLAGLVDGVGDRGGALVV